MGYLSLDSSIAVSDHTICLKAQSPHATTPAAYKYFTVETCGSENVKVVDGANPIQYSLALLAGNTTTISGSTFTESFVVDSTRCLPHYFLRWRARTGPQGDYTYSSY